MFLSALEVENREGEMAATVVQKEQLDAQLLEGEAAAAAAAAAQGLEDGEHVEAGGKEGDVDTKLAVKDEGLVPAAATPAAMTDIEKKRRRAERFGTDLKISEADKRKLRAARFNDGTKNVANDVVVKTTDKVSDSSSKTPALTAEAKSALLKAENAKRKARAERFGSIPQEVTTVKPKNEVSAKPKFSQDEEAKKKARMARFAMAAK